MHLYVVTHTEDLLVHKLKLELPLEGGGMSL